VEHGEKNIEDNANAPPHPRVTRTHSLPLRTTVTKIRSDFNLSYYDVNRKIKKNEKLLQPLVCEWNFRSRAAGETDLNCCNALEIGKQIF
jgi:hypothetical protein